MEIAESIYNHSPILIQNLLVSGYGYKLKKLRYGGNYKHHLSQLLKSQYYSTAEIKDIQSDLFKELITSALSSTPFYMDFIKQKNIRSSDININNYRSILPVITKDVFRQKQDAFISRETGNYKTITNSTSGTSGTPLKIITNATALQKNYAFFSRLLNWSGISYGDRGATFAGRLIIPPKQTEPPFWRLNIPSNNMLLSSYHISEKTIPAYIKALENFKPAYIDSYPSAIYEIAKYIVANNHNHHIEPTAVITSSETLYDYQRDVIERAFNCKVFDHLGSAEMVTFITQCEHGHYHINPEYGLFEVLDNENNPVDPGSAGSLVCTGLFNTAMPLIRYELGDSIALSTDSCKCGRNFPVVKSIVGRTDDLIIGCDGRKVGRLDPIFKKMDGSIKEAQIIQTGISNITLRLATEKNYNKEKTEDILSELKSRIGDCMNIKVEYVSSIEKTSSGKFRAVISQLYNN